MASADAVSPSSARRSLRHLLFNPPSPSSPRPHRAADWNPLIAPPPPQPPRKKKGLAAAAFRGLGCASASASQAYAPAAAAAAAVRSSADWQGKRPRRRREKKKAERKNQAIGDVWCAPGMPFAAEASVDCVVAHQPMVSRGRPDAAERIHRERPYFPRRVGHREEISTFMDSPPVLDTPFFGPDLFPSGHLRHLRGFHRAPGGLEELMMFQTRILLGGRLDVYDRFREWRLDVDNMSYEELLELGDKIGSVSTGLREEEIARSLRKIKHSVFDASARHLATEIERKCSICQEEYEANDETGRLECGHGYHMYCIKQWLLLKNACPVCKAPVLKT